MDNTTIQQLIGQVGTVITIVSPLVYAIYKLSRTKIDSYFQAKINTIDNTDLRTFAQNTLELVDSLITKEVTNADITLKPTILQAISDGKVSADELSTLKTTVKANVLNQLTEDSKIALNSTIANVDIYLNSSVEAILGKLKLDSSSPVSKTILPEKSVEVVDTSALTNQINQLQSDKDSLAQQVNQAQEDKRQSDLSWQELANQVSTLTSEKQTLQSKLDSITQVVQPVANNVQSVNDTNIPTK